MLKEIFLKVLWIVLSFITITIESGKKKTIRKGLIAISLSVAIPINTEVGCTTKAITFISLPAEVQTLILTGFVFPDGSERYLSEDDIAAIQNRKYNGEPLVQYAINELYAKHGYSFEGSPKWDTFYSNCSWYVNEHLSSIDARSQFTDIESANLIALARIRDQS